MASRSRTRLQLRELRELGWSRTAFRVRWEAETRLGIRGRRALPPLQDIDHAWTARVPFGDPTSIADAVRDRIPLADLTRLRAEAHAAGHGIIRAFGQFDAAYGEPPDWFLNPMTGKRHDSAKFWSRALSGDAGDIKLTWEIARFPHAYTMARAAAFFPSERTPFAGSLVHQIRDFEAHNPPRRGPHWASAQEIALRNLGFVFALSTLLDHDVTDVVARSLHTGARHTLDVIEYSEKAVYNNHLLSEALGLYAAGVLLSDTRCRDKGRDVLEEQASVQFYSDGGYILLSLNYERAALQLLLYACSLARAEGSSIPRSWLHAMDRALTFMLAHQNPCDGRMPNVGPNDGSLPCPLSTCDILDFRPTLQAISVATRGERVYPPGPWDEETVWWLGPVALDAPLRLPQRKSMSFGRSGFHVIRSKTDDGTFATLRCGTIPDRFGQMDMLHADIWWRGQNVAIDAGTFMYDVDEPWLRYFDGTSSHNTLMLDDEEQMVLFRRFKHLYPTQARLTEFGETRVAGEHYGYRRLRGNCVHHRTVTLDGERFVVTDEIRGSGQHRARLHWLLGDFPFDVVAGGVILSTPVGRWRLEVRDGRGEPLDVDVAVGQDAHPRGWASRHYANRFSVPSLVANQSTDLPIHFTTIAGPL